MITLSTINNYSLQEIFDQCTIHLLTQNKQCLSFDEDEDEHCCYKNDDGLKCAVGCFISDEEYNPEFENRHLDIILNKLNNQLNTNRKNLLSDLQRIHDDTNPDKWKDKLIELSGKYNLDFKY